MFKFKIGQKVIFNQGQPAIDVGSPERVEAVIRARYNQNGTIIYNITYRPSGNTTVLGGNATVLEKELSLKETP